MISRFLHAVACITVHSFLLLSRLQCMNICFVYPFVLMGLWCFQFGATINKAEMNICAHTSVCSFLLSKYTRVEFLSGLVRVWLILRNCLRIFQTHYTILHSHQQFMSVFAAPHAHQHLACRSFSLSSFYWVCTTVSVLTYIYLMTNNVEYMFMSVLVTPCEVSGFCFCFSHLLTELSYYWRVLSIYWIQILYQLYILQILFSPIMWLNGLSYSLLVSFKEQKFNFETVQLFLFCSLYFLCSNRF